MPTRRIRLFFVKCAYSDLGDIFFHNFRGFFDSTIEKDGTQLLNNENGSDEKCSQCACFWLKIIKGILFGVWDLLQNSFDSELIYRWRKISLKKTIWLILLGVQLLRISTDQTTSSLEMRNDFCWFILLGFVEGESWSKSYVSHLWHLLRYMSVDELL